MTLRTRNTNLPATTSEVLADTRWRTLQGEQRPIPVPFQPHGCLTAATIGTPNDGDQTGRWQPWLTAVTFDLIIVSATSVPGDGQVQMTVADEVVFAVDASSYSRTAVEIEVSPMGQVRFALAGSGFVQLVVQAFFRGEGGGGLVFGANSGGGV